MDVELHVAVNGTWVVESQVVSPVRGTAEQDCADDRHLLNDHDAMLTASSEMESVSLVVTVNVIGACFYCDCLVASDCDFGCGPSFPCPCPSTSFLPTRLSQTTDQIVSPGWRQK